MTTTSRSLADLDPEVARRVRNFISACEKAGIDVIITSTYRSLDSQAALYAQGRTAAGPIVTAAKPGWSWHNWGRAADFAPLINGKIPWQDIATFRRCGEIAESCGLEWAGRWKTFKELAHVQYTAGLTLADLNKEA